jgi:hypothetical protein
MATVKVTLGLTDRDVDNANYIYAWTRSRTRAQAVSIALSLTRYLIEQRRTGARIQIRHENGTIERIVMTELENLASPEEAEKALAALRARSAT